MFEPIYTASVLVLMTFLLVKEVTKPSVILFGSLLLLVVGNILTIDKALEGFSNQGMLTVGVLFVVAAAIQSSSRFEDAVLKLLGNRSRKWTQYLRLMFPVSGLSAFLNNTPIVASLIPIVNNWAKRSNLASSKFLIPLSYAAILGGICTLIGTSTNLVIHGMMLDHGLDGFSFFEIGKVGLPIALFGILFFSFWGHRLLPQRKDAITQFEESTRKFVVETRVDKSYPNIGKTIEKAGLRHLQGLFLFQIMREGQTIAPVSPDERIEIGDRLFFTGLPETIYELQKTPGLNAVKDVEFDPRNIDSDKLTTFEVVLSSVSPVLGKTVRDSNFRSRYNAVILGIHRAGSRINKKIGDIELKANDTLFIMANKNFDRKWYHTKDFALVTSSFSSYSKPEKKGNIALILMILMVAAAALKLTPMLIAAACAALIMILINIISFSDAKNSVDFEVLIIIASALGIGKALLSSGLAEIVANALISATKGFGVIGVIAGLFIVTNLYTEFITNNAGAAIMFPIAFSISQSLGADPMPFMLIIAIGASASFSTPIGYQTNLLVYNVGGYKYSDFFKAGIFMNIAAGIIATFMIYLLYFV